MGHKVCVSRCCSGEKHYSLEITSPNDGPLLLSSSRSPSSSLHPVAPVSVDLHHTVLGQRFPGVGGVELLAVHLVPAQRVQAHGRDEAPLKLDLLAEVGGPLLTGVPRALLGGGQEDHQLKVGGAPLAERRVQGAAAVQQVEEGEGEDEEGAGPRAQVVQLEVQRGLVQRLAVALLVEHGAHLHLHQGALKHVGGPQHEAGLALVLPHHRLGAELDGSGALLGTGDLGHEGPWMLDTTEEVEGGYSYVCFLLDLVFYRSFCYCFTFLYCPIIPIYSRKVATKEPNFSFSLQANMIVVFCVLWP